MQRGENGTAYMVFLPSWSPTFCTHAASSALLLLIFYSIPFMHKITRPSSYENLQKLFCRHESCFFGLNVQQNRLSAENLP